ncbi:hypothetical protein TcasGA2_TC016179 [Tribolium castaneum]|uniref:Uncharacterized protein n=1 Tax=Tribolium castaneum TaxID=7070 RepID=D7EIZ9_TRICA|nr:hypothetical protein TcasGA2_TC016179 [Tribolium castaneum]
MVKRSPQRKTQDDQNQNQDFTYHRCSSIAPDPENTPNEATQPIVDIPYDVPHSPLRTVFILLPYITPEKALETTDILATLRPPTKRFNRRCRCVQRLPEIVEEETHYVNIDAGGRCKKDFKENHPGKTMSIYDILEIVASATPLALTQTNIEAGFRKTGIYPYNRNLFIEIDLTDRPNPENTTKAEFVPVCNIVTPDEETPLIIIKPPIESEEPSNVHEAFVIQQQAMNIRQSSPVPQIEQENVSVVLRL